MKRQGLDGLRNGITRELSGRCLVVLTSSTKLLSNLRAKYLISSRLFTAWLADHLLIANLAQVGFIAQLISIYLADMSRHVVNGRTCIRGACEKIKEVSR
jgi:mediator of RNA polymerase II transcription subunit 12